MKKSAFAITLLIALLGCSKPKTATTPDQTIGNLVQALNTQDSGLFLANLDRSIRTQYERSGRVQHTFDTVKGSHFSYAMISSDTDGTVANVSFWVSSTGKITVPRTRVDAQLYKEDGDWKFGTVWAMNGKKER